MFKFIGGAVVYGFALLGLAKYLEERSEGDGRYAIPVPDDFDRDDK